MTDNAAPISAEPGETTTTLRDAYSLKSWERVVDGVLDGPGYAIDLKTDDILFFVSPRWMNANRSRNEEDSA
jgi:hypothetical protein